MKQLKYHPGRRTFAGYYWVRKAVVILLPAYVLCVMFEVLEPPKPLVRHTWDDAMMALGRGPRVYTRAELKAEGVGRRPLLRYTRHTY